MNNRKENERKRERVGEKSFTDLSSEKGREREGERDRDVIYTYVI